MHAFPSSSGFPDDFPDDPIDDLDDAALRRTIDDLTRLRRQGAGSAAPESRPSGSSTPDPAADGMASGDGPTEDTYWGLSRTPLTSLVFTLPLVLAYEGGVLLLGRGTPRNGADVWLRHLLDALGFGAYFLLPALTVLGLLAWHHVEHERWRYSTAVLVGMAGECVLWALALVGVARLQERFWPLGIGGLLADGLCQFGLVQEGHGWGGVFARLIGFCGAGLYEEVLFRLLLLPAVLWTLERLGFSTLAACLWSLVLTSLLFSAAHYVGPLGDTFELYSFTFRALAGCFFGTLFLLRGFGIAAGTHACYDLIIGLL